MFKKSVEAKSQQRLSGADRKKLKRTLKQRFPRASDADFDTLLPPKAELTVSKYPNRVLVYGLEDDCPMFYDIDGRGSEIFPTVYALWKVPDILPTFMVKGGEVSHFILGGADLMFPGVYIPPEGLPTFSAGAPWAVKVPGNPAPIAVGTTSMSSSEAVKAGFRGKALLISHYYRDTLWESAENCYVPNAGFYENVVFEDPTLANAGQASDSFEDDPSIVEEKVISNEDLEDANEEISSTIDVATTGDTALTNTIDAMAHLQVGGNSSGVEPNVDEQQSLSVEEVDVLLDKCLLQALHTTVKDLPMPGSILWSSHVLPCRPSGVTLDIKKSSFKKLSKWLQSKSATGLISVKEDKHKKETTLLSVNHKHPDYTSFKPEKKQNNEKTVTSVAEGQSKNMSLDVIEVFKPSSHVNPIFIATGADTSMLCTALEASQVVFDYIEKEKLVKQADKSMVILDATLCDALFKGAIKKGSMYPTEIHKKDVGKTFISRMQPHLRVSRGSESVVRKGTLKPIQILTERRQGNKKVTKLSGLETFLIDGEALAAELQKKCACSTTVAELPGKKGLEVLVQGGVIDDLAAHLVEQYGVQKRYIEVLDKTKKK